jgi:hypothetical protein
MAMDLPTATAMSRENIHAQLGGGSYEEVNIQGKLVEHQTLQG